MSDAFASQDRLPIRRTACRAARAELTAWCLEGALRGRMLRSMEKRTLPFLDPGDPLLRPLSDAAKLILTAERSADVWQRRLALARAHTTLGLATTIIGHSDGLPSSRSSLLQQMSSWRRSIEDDIRAAGHAAVGGAGLRGVFVTGAPITIAESSTFKGRHSLIASLDLELSTDRPAPLLLLGERRIGKSSLLNLLPRRLGSEIMVVSINLQALSGNLHRGAVHSFVARAILAEFPGLVRAPDDLTRPGVMHWLGVVDRWLLANGRRLMITLDEVERWEDGIREGWADLSLLDLLQASCQRFYRMRFLLATGWSLRDLGPHWERRLKGVQTFLLGVLDRGSARELLIAPVEGFPAEIYPAGGVEMVLDRTGCHPLLLQLTGDALLRALVDQGKDVASLRDLEDALDQTLVEADGALFRDLWLSLSSSQQVFLREVARRGARRPTEDPVIATLLQRNLVTQTEERVAFAVPLFSDWVHSYS